ncbi:MAG: AraC family transcriptional regulator [Oscillospiraceae bacterium]|nr:AraC family transcriptional regulator [Oscillospiraceae bacterium]
MDWLTGIQNAINYIEEHLTEEIDYEVLAKEAACSNFYFQRIFGILCGISLGDYIRNRRLTLAGDELSSSDDKVIDVALKYGYESPESFTRAFSRFHGVTPSDAKKDGSKLKSFSRILVKITLSGGSVMNYKIIEKEAFDIIEKVETHSVDDSVNAKSIPEFWSRSHQDGTVKTLMNITTDRTFIFGICYGNLTENAKTFDYSIAATYANDAVVPEGFRRNTIPARTWAVFECKGAMPNAIQDLWHKIVTEFFPTSSYKPTYEMDIEAYSEGNMDAPDYYSEIWIPVVKK